MRNIIRYEEIKKSNIIYRWKEYNFYKLPNGLNIERKNVWWRHNGDILWHMKYNIGFIVSCSLLHDRLWISSVLSRHTSWDLRRNNDGEAPTPHTKRNNIESIRQHPTGMRRA